MFDNVFKKQGIDVKSKSDWIYHLEEELENPAKIEYLTKSEIIWNK